MEERQVKNPRSFVGTVVASKMRKTAVVEVTRTKRHPRYLKLYPMTRRFKCRDERGEAKPGDRVEIRETRPLSRDVRWKIVRVIANNANRQANIANGKNQEKA